MQLTLGIVLLAAASAVAAPNDAYFYTNSYKHTDVRAYPLHRAGHNRFPATKTCAESPECMTSPRHTRMEKLMKMKEEHYAQCKASGECPMHRDAVFNVACSGGTAGEYACNNVDLQSFVPILDLGGGDKISAADIWGWTDPETGDEIAIIGMEDGTGFVQVTDATNPIVLGFLKQAGSVNRPWSDMKVFRNHVFIVREVIHGMQVFDLTKLRQYYGQASDNVRQLTEDNNYREVTTSHNIVINEETGFAYIVGTSTCSGGLHAVDINDPKNPRYAGCFSSDGYTHDAQCVIYSGPDTRYTGREICFAYNEDTVTIVDVTDKSNMRQVSRVTYANAWYTHQGWITEDMKYMLANDELDEIETPSYQYTRTLLWDIQDLELPVLIGPHYAANEAVDHNLYIKGDLAYLANYCSGLEILDVSQMVQGITPQVAFFDLADCNTATFAGAWSSYPYFDSGTVVVSSIELGLFVLKPQDNLLG